MRREGFSFPFLHQRKSYTQLICQSHNWLNVISDHNKQSKIIQIFCLEESNYRDLTCNLQLVCKLQTRGRPRVTTSHLHNTSTNSSVHFGHVFLLSILFSNLQHCFFLFFGHFRNKNKTLEGTGRQGGNNVSISRSTSL